MKRRDFLASTAAAPLLTMAASNSAQPATPPVKLGIDLFSIRAQKWTPFQFLDYAAKQKVQVVHFSEIRFIGSLEPDNLRRVREYAASKNIEVEIGMKSICPSSKMFDPSEGTAEQQLSKMLDSAHIVGSHIVRCVLGSADDRRPGPIEAHIKDMVGVLHNIRPKAKDLGLKIAIENHAGDMQARELKMLIEDAGPDFVGACLDSGNPLWTLESPHVTLETLHPYVLTSHVRDSAVWRVPEGAAVSWVQMGRGNVGIEEYVRKYAELCPGRALSMETIVMGPRKFAYRDKSFWDGYRNVRAWEFERFVELVDAGKPYQPEPWETADEGRREIAALEESLAFTKKVFGLPTA